MSDFFKFDKKALDKHITAGPEDELEPDFTCEWAIIAVNTKGNMYIMAADGGFTAFEYWQEDDISGYFSAIDIPSEWTKEPPVAGVYKVTGMTCIDDGRRETQEGVEYDGPCFGGGKWELLFDIDQACPGEPLNTEETDNG